MSPFQSDTTPLHIAVTIDVTDLEAQAMFWSELLGVEVNGIMEPFAFIEPAPGRKIDLWLQRVPEEKAGKNRVHLDFAVPDLAATERRVVELGGSLGDRHEWGKYRWRICRDPEGNEFDIMQADPFPIE